MQAVRRFDIIEGLQWGHSSEAVDEMASSRWASRPVNCLQWGHSSEAVDETAPADVWVAIPIRLQWGHSSEAVDEADRFRPPHQGGPSMGPQLGSCG